MKNKGSDPSFLLINLQPLLYPLGPHRLADKQRMFNAKINGMNILVLGVDSFLII